MKRLVFLLVVLIFCQIGKAGVIFSDDFEDGTLNKWTIDGRQEGFNIAEVISKDDSQVGHLYHSGYTEITIEKTFDYTDKLTFNFDMEVQASSPFSSTSYYYSMGGVYFAFYDDSSEIIRVISYVYSTSSYPFEHYNVLPNSYYFYSVPQGEMLSYSLNAEDMLVDLGHDPELADSVRFYFRAYASEPQSELISNVWADNVVVTPEPATISLLAFGGLGLLFRRRK